MATKASARSTGVKAPCVSIDIGAASVRVVEVEWSMGSGDDATARVVRRGMANLPHNAWNELPASRPAFITAIREALSAAGITARNVVACFPRRMVTLRFVRLPHAPPEQLRGMVTFEAQQHILFSLDEVILDYHVLEAPLAGLGIADADDMDTILLAAARRSLIADLMAIFEQAGLELEQLSVSALALSEHLRDSLEPTALIDIKPGEMDVAVVSEGRLLFTRESTLETHGGSPDVAERRLVEEAARSFTSYQNEFRNKTLGRVFLAGTNMPGVNAERITHALSEVLDMPVALWQGRMTPPGDPDARAYAAAIGVALQARERAIAPINLVPNDRAIHRAQQARLRRQRVAAVGAVVGILLIIFFVQKTFAARNALQARTRQANMDLNEVTDRLDARKKTFDKLQALSTAVTEGLDRNHPVVDVLAALSGSLPKSTDIWLTQFSSDRNGLITLRGETKNQMAATDFVIQLQSSGVFRQVRLGYLGDAQETTSTASVPAPRVTPIPASPLPALPGLPNPGGPPPGGPAPANAGGPPPGSGVNAGASANPAGAGPSVSPSTAAPTGDASKKSSAPTLTSFVITCRVNPQAKDLVGTKTPETRTVASAKTTGAGLKNVTKTSTETDTNGGTDEDQ